MMYTLLFTLTALVYGTVSQSNCKIDETLRVTVVLAEPYITLKNDSDQYIGNDKYQGYCADLLREIAILCNMSYIITPVKDGQFGLKLPNNSWTGMMGELLRNEADLIVGSFSITYERSQVIDFTVPFMHLGIAIMIRKPHEESPSLFAFFDPFTPRIWGFVTLAYVAISIALWIISRLSPTEHIDSNQFSIGNSGWYIVAALLNQGTAMDPRALSTRILTTVWWFFILIIVSSYTANLAAFLTVKRLTTTVDSVDALSKQTKTQYGTVDSGSTLEFFRGAQIQPYIRMWEYMSKAEPSVFVKTSGEGVRRVLNDDYAYIAESTYLEYYLAKNCNLTLLGNPLDAKGYGIGLRKDMHKAALFVDTCVGSLISE